MEIKFLNNLEFKDLIDELNLKTYKYNDEINGYEGFRFLLDVDYFFNSNSFIVAYEGDILYGLIKLVNTNYKNKEIKGISFIDINLNYKNQGIATKLIKYFDDFNTSNIFLSSKPCEEGKKYKIDKIIRRITDKKVVFI